MDVLGTGLWDIVSTPRGLPGLVLQVVDARCGVKFLKLVVNFIKGQLGQTQ